MPRAARICEACGFPKNSQRHFLIHYGKGIAEIYGGLKMSLEPVHYYGYCTHCARHHTAEVLLVSSDANLGPTLEIYCNSHLPATTVHLLNEYHMNVPDRNLHRKRSEEAQT